MITQEQIRQARRVVHEAEHGSTEEKVNARRAAVDYLKKTLAALEESGTALAIGRIAELEAENAALRRAEEAECTPRFQVGRMKQPKFEWHDGKMAAVGKDA